MFSAFSLDLSLQDPKIPRSPNLLFFFVEFHLQKEVQLMPGLQLLRRVLVFASDSIFVVVHGEMRQFICAGT